MTTLVAGIAALVAGVSGAPPNAAIAYSAPSDCPPVDVFIALVEQRVGGRWRVASGSGDVRFSVEITGAAGGRTGRVVRTKGGTQSAPREVAGGSCGDLVEALAFITALSLEEPPSSDTPVAAVAAAPSPAAGAVPAAWTAGAVVSVWALLPPQPMTGAGIFVERGLTDWGGRRISLRPDMRFSLLHSRNDVVQDPGRARFALLAAELDVCPVGARANKSLVLRLCAAGTAGMLWGRGLDIDVPRTARSLWASAGVLGRARLALGRRARIALHAGAVAPLRPADFVFDTPRVTVGKVPAVTWSAGLAAGWTIP